MTNHVQDVGWISGTLIPSVKLWGRFLLNVDHSVTLWPMAATVSTLTHIFFFKGMYHPFKYPLYVQVCDYM